MREPSPPESVRTERLLLRRWRREHAVLLKAALDASVNELKPWIPWTIAEPAPVPELELRIDRFAADFDARREWLYAVLPPDESELFGGLSLHPRSASGRVPFSEADRIEIGYWLASGITGRGYATEAARAVLAIAVALPGMTHVEIRCDPRNERSVSVARRLGFRHAHTHGELMVWELSSRA